MKNCLIFVRYFSAKRSKKGKKITPHGAMGEKFQEDPLVRNRKWSNRCQGIYLKVKELNVVTKDHACMKLYKSILAPGEEDKTDFSM